LLLIARITDIAQRFFGDGRSFAAGLRVVSKAINSQFHTADAGKVSEALFFEARGYSRMPQAQTRVTI